MILSWGHTVHGQFQLLAGKSAPHDFIQLIIYKAVTFSDEIEKIDTVRAYHVSQLVPLPRPSRPSTDPDGPFPQCGPVRRRFSYRPSVSRNVGSADAVCSLARACACAWPRVR